MRTEMLLIFHSDRYALRQVITVIHHYSENQKFLAVHSLRNEAGVLSDTICYGTWRFLNFSQWRLHPRRFQDTELYR